MLPKRTSSQAYSHSPPPTSRDIPHSRFHHPKRVQSPRNRDQPLQGTVEAPAFEGRVRRPEPPPPKKSRIEFGTRPVASGPSSSSRQLPISPPTKRSSQEGAASPEAHRPPSFGAPSSRGEIKQGETIRISAIPKVKVKAFPPKAYPQANSPPPPAPQQPPEPRKKSPPDVAKRAIEKEREERELAEQKAKAEAEKEQASERSAPPRSRSKNKISRGASKTPEPPADQNWFRPTPPQERPDPPDLPPSRPKRVAPSPKPPLPPPPLHQTLHQENKSRKAPPDKAPPARFVREQLEAERGAASGAPSRSSNLAPHPQADQGREPPTNPRRQHYRDAPRAQVLDWARHQVFRIGLDWHGVLDNNLNQFKVLDNRTAELIAGLSSAEIPVEFAIVSFAGGARAPGLEQELTAFIGDCRHRGLPFIGYCITRERVGPGGKSDVVATHGINYFVDDTNYIVNEIRRTRAGAFLQPQHPQSHDWIFELQNLLRNWRGSLADLCHHFRPLKLRPDQYSSDPKSNRGYW